MSLKFPRLIIAEGAADQALKEVGIHKLPVDPFEIAKFKDILVKAKPPENDGFSGMLARYGKTYGILYSTFVKSEGFQRFSIAHELGHYFMPGHMEQLLAKGPHKSRAGFSSTDPYEQEADFFAAALLMPSRFVKPIIDRHDDGMELAKKLADECVTSLTASAIRYARLTESAVAVILSTEGTINFTILSETMKDAKIGWLKAGTPVPKGTETYRFGQDEANVKEARNSSSTMDIIDWFDCPQSHRVTEEVVGLGSYGKILTVIHSKKLTAAAASLDDDDLEEEELRESWTPRFR